MNIQTPVTAADAAPVPRSCCPTCGQALAKPHLLFEPGRTTISYQGKSVRLTKHEFDLVQYLYEQAPRVCDKRDILDNLYQFCATDEQAEIKIIDVYVCKIRRKIRAAGIAVEIVTHWGTGYSLRAEGERIDHLRQDATDLVDPDKSWTVAHDIALKHLVESGTRQVTALAARLRQPYRRIYEALDRLDLNDRALIS